MQNSIRLSLSILSLWYPCTTFAISIVYNYRIAQVTKQPIVENVVSKPVTFVALLFDQYQKKYDNETRQNFAGGFGSLIYEFDPCYLRADFAFSHIQQTVHHVTNFTDTETDDILFTFGSNIIKDGNKTVALSGLFGVPTHAIFRLQHVDFGYNQVGLGTQLDATYRFKDTGHAVLGGLRYVYFVPRTAYDSLCMKHTFSIGQLSDLLFAYKKNWNSHGLEFGYTTRFEFGASVFPNFDDIVEKTNYRRCNFYGIYKYKFLINDMPNRLLFNISYGFDTRPKTFGNQHVVTLWAAWNINF